MKMVKALEGMGEGAEGHTENKEDTFLWAPRRLGVRPPAGLLGSIPTHVRMCVCVGGGAPTPTSTPRPQQ